MTFFFYFLISSIKTGLNYASEREQDLLLEIYNEYRSILEDQKKRKKKNTEFTMQSKSKKAKAWKDIASSFNASEMGC